MAQPGGVLTRAGHTEAGCDLARLAGLEPAAVIVEIMNDDGTMARRPTSSEFARQHGLEDRHDRRPDPTTARTGALGRAHRRARGRDRVRARSACAVTRTTSTARCTSRWCAGARRATPRSCACTRRTRRATCSASAARALAGRCASARSASPTRARRRRAAATRRERRAISCERGRAARREPASRARRRGAVLRTYGIGAQILRDLGVRRMRVLSAPRQMHGISAFGLEVVEYVSE